MFPEEPTLAETVVDDDTQVIDKKDIIIDLPWNVVIFDDPKLAMDTVVEAIVSATNRSVKEAFEIMMDVHEKGRGLAYSGSFLSCLPIKSILDDYGLTTELQG